MFNAVIKGFGIALGVTMGIGMVGGITFIVLANNDKFMDKLKETDPEMFNALQHFYL